MAKEETNEFNIKGWQKFLLWGIMLIFGCGLAFNQINRNTDNIKTNIVDIKSNEKRLDKTELNQVVLLETNKAIAVALSTINISLIDIMREQGNQKIIQAVNSEKLKTLTKD